MKALNSRKKIIISIIALAVALVVATGSTYAWFTMGNTVTLDDFQVGVTTETDNLYVAAGTINTADNTVIADTTRGDRKAISTTAAGLYDIDTNTYKITLSQDTINDLLIHQYGAMVSGKDGNNKVKNYPLIGFTTTMTDARFLVGTGNMVEGTDYYLAATGADKATTVAGADASKYYVQATVTPDETGTSYYYFNEATQAPVVIYRTGTGTSNDKFAYKLSADDSDVNVYPNTAMDALTTVDGKNFTNIAGDEAVVAIDADATEEIDKMANFTEFKVYFRSTAEAYDISLGNSANVAAIDTLAAKITAWASAAANTYGSNGVYDDAITANVTDIAARAANAVRISFTNEVGETFIWNPNADTGYNKGNLADDYWAYLHGGVAASTTYAASYAKYLAREDGPQSYVLTADAEAVTGKTYYTDGYTKDTTVTAADYEAKKYFTATAIPTLTGKFVKLGDNYNQITDGTAPTAGSTYVTLAETSVPNGTAVVPGTKYFIKVDAINEEPLKYQLNTFTDTVNVDNVYTLVESDPVSYAAGTYFETANSGTTYTKEAKVANDSLANCCIMTLATGAFDGDAVYYDRSSTTYAEGVYEKIINVEQDSSATDFDGTTLTTLKYVQADAAYEANLTVRVWLEGWDGDCFDDILADFFQTTLSFSGHVA